MKLKNWVAQCGGPRVAAELLGISKSAVTQWLRREATPNSARMLQIFKLSKGMVRFEQMIRETKPKAVANAKAK